MLHEFLQSNLLLLRFKLESYIWTNLNQRADIFLCFYKSMWLIILSFLLVYTLLQIHSPGEDSAIFLMGRKEQLSLQPD